MLSNDIEKVLVSTEQLQKRIREMGAQLAAEYQGKNPLVVCVLRGAVMFMTDLTRAMDIPLEIDFMDVSSYESGTTSSGHIKIIKDLDASVAGRHVLLVEDIVDTGRTLSHLLELFRMRDAASVKVVSLLDKPERRLVSLDVDYIGMEVPNEFVVGYGLDFAQKYRNLPYIGVLKPELYQTVAES